jgi:hypothetical protein
MIEHLPYIKVDSSTPKWCSYTHSRFSNHEICYLLYV